MQAFLPTYPQNQCELRGWKKKFMHIANPTKLKFYQNTIQ